MTATMLGPPTLAPPVNELKFYDPALILEYQRCVKAHARRVALRIACVLSAMGAAVIATGIFTAVDAQTTPGMELGILVAVLGVLVLTVAGGVLLWRKRGGLWATEVIKADDIPDLLANESIPEAARDLIALAALRYPGCRMVMKSYIVDPILGSEIELGTIRDFVVFDRKGLVEPADYIACH